MAQENGQQYNKCKNRIHSKFYTTGPFKYGEYTEKELTINSVSVVELDELVKSVEFEKQIITTRNKIKLAREGRNETRKEAARNEALKVEVEPTPETDAETGAEGQAIHFRSSNCPKCVDALPGLDMKNYRSSHNCVEPEEPGPVVGWWPDEPKASASEESDTDAEVRERSVGNNCPQCDNAPDSKMQECQSLKCPPAPKV